MDQQRQEPAGAPQWKSWWLRPWTVPSIPIGPWPTSGSFASTAATRRTSRLLSESHPDRCGCPVTGPTLAERRNSRSRSSRSGTGWVTSRSATSPLTGVPATNLHRGRVRLPPRGQAVDPVKPSGMSTSTWNAPWLREFGSGGIGMQAHHRRHPPCRYRTMERWFSTTDAVTDRHHRGLSDTFPVTGGPSARTRGSAATGGRSRRSRSARCRGRRTRRSRRCRGRWR